MRLRDTSLQLSVAVGAKETALRRLGPGGVKGAGEPALSEPECLVARVAVVKVERAGVAIVAAALAVTAGFVDEDLLDAAPATGDRVRTAAKAAVDPTRLQPELCLAMAEAGHPAPVGTLTSNALTLPFPDGWRLGL